MSCKVRSARLSGVESGEGIHNGEAAKVVAEVVGQEPNTTGRVRAMRARLRGIPKLSALFLVAIVMAAIFADQLAPHDPTDLDFAYKYAPPVWTPRGQPIACWAQTVSAATYSVGSSTEHESR